MRWIRQFLVLWVALAMAACSQQEAIDKLAPHPESEYAQDALKQLHDRQFDRVEALLAPKVRSTPGLEATLGKMADEFPPGQAVSTKLVGAYTMARMSSSTSPGTSYNLTYEFQFPQGWALANVLLVRHGDTLEIGGLHVQRLAQSLEQKNAFTFSGKPPTYWLFAALVAVLPLFCLISFVVCLCTPIRRRKWLWAIGTLLGVVSLKLNWSTGDLDSQLVSVQLFSASAFAQFYSPWVLSISLPLGSILFWIKRKRLRDDALAAKVGPPPLSSPAGENQVQAERHEDGTGKTIDPA